MTAPAIDSSIKILAEIEPEFTKPCIVCSDQGKSSPAEWIVYVSHARDTCPADFFVCTPHKEQLDRHWVNSLKEWYGLRCSGCKQPVTGQVSDHYRAIKL